MKRMLTARFIHAAAAAVWAFALPDPLRAGDADADGHYSQWELAAIDRDAAAETQEVEASALLQKATELRRAAFLYAEERVVNMSRAGALEAQAGDLFGRAFNNYDKSSANWNKAVSEYKRRDLGEKRADAAERYELAVARALGACQMAAESYEHAAEAYDADNARQPAACAAASEKAAEWREKLAARL